MRSLSYGDHGPEVAFLHSRLTALGFGPPGDSPSYGARTVTAVSAFQRAHGLPVTGEMDGASWLIVLRGNAQTGRFIGDDMPETDMILAFSDGDGPDAPLIGETDPNFRGVEAGGEGDLLGDAQIRLRALGYAVDAESTLGPSTAAAIRTFQDKRFLAPTGTLNEETWNQLRVETAGTDSLLSFASPEDLADQGGGPLNFGGEYRDVPSKGGYTYRQYEDGALQILASPQGGLDGRLLFDGAAWRAITAEIGRFPAAMRGTGVPMASRGDRGASAKAVQVRLNELGFGPLSEDGIYGGGTASAVSAVQKALGLTVTGNVDAATATALGDPWPELTVGSKGSLVADRQARLNSLGYALGKADGIFGAKTAAAVKDFQTSRKLAVTGIIDDRTHGRLLIGEAIVPATISTGDKERLSAAAQDALPLVADAYRAQVSALLTEAISWHGKKEIPKGSNAGAEIGPITADTYRTGESAPPWCALAICHWLKVALKLDSYNDLPWGWRNAHALSFGQWGDKTGRLVPAGASVPPGSIFVMYRAGSGSDAAGKRSSSLGKWEGPGHTGIVIADMGTRVLTIEGNVGDRVWSDSRAKSDLVAFITWWTPEVRNG